MQRQNAPEIRNIAHQCPQQKPFGAIQNRKPSNRLRFRPNYVPKGNSNRVNRFDSTHQSPVRALSFLIGLFVKGLLYHLFVSRRARRPSRKPFHNICPLKNVNRWNRVKSWYGLCCTVCVVLCCTVCVVDTDICYLSACYHRNKR